jgi:DNA-binding GntR family transcriptional regulator
MRWDPGQGRRGPVGGAKLDTKPLREQVYDYLKGELNRGALAPGGYLDLNAIARELGTSRTPLREALLQLASEGFVTILPRRGVVVNALTLDEIRHVYEIVGALEGAALLAASPRLTRARVSRMRALSLDMKRALKKGDFTVYYQKNLAFHDVFLGLCDNARLVRTVRLLKERLYDFPRKERYVKAWEEASVLEHDAIAGHLGRGDFGAAADYLRDVHWSFPVQERFIREYYLGIGDKGPGTKD